MTRKHRSAEITLQGRKADDPATIVPQHRLNALGAEAARAVVQEDRTHRSTEPHLERSTANGFQVLTGSSAGAYPSAVSWPPWYSFSSGRLICDCATTLARRRPMKSSSRVHPLSACASRKRVRPAFSSRMTLG